MTDEEPHWTPPHPDGEEAPLAFSEGLAADDQAGDEVDPAILEELEKLRNPRSSWVKSVVILAVSVGLFFFFFRMFDNPLLDVLMIIGVLLVHELGHFLGMRAFGYRDVRMFFIPFFGAAVSGRNTGVAAYKQAIVVLLGPVPGLCLALVLILLWAWLQIDVLHRLSLLLAIINGFNLLPVFPLDGGRLLQITLFSRNRYAESLVNVLAAAVLILAGLGSGAWILAILGAFVLLATGHAFKVSTLAGELRAEIPSAPGAGDDEIPPPALRAILDRVRLKFPALTAKKTIARVVLQVWEKMHARAPGALATLCLLCTYLFFLAAMLVVPVVLMVAFRMAGLTEG